MDVLKKVPVREQDASVRATNFEEVCLGYNKEEAMEEASRCINCKNKPQCVQGCPVSINIPGFVEQVKNGDFEKAYEIISESRALPAVCGRVCPQESQCEGKCIRGIKGEPVSIGKLERFVADWASENNIKPVSSAEKKGPKVPVIGSGPAGLTVAADCARAGHEVTVFEAFHKCGGVMMYGIPEFRLPKKIVQDEIENLKKIGVKFETNFLVGRTDTLDQLLSEKGFDAAFVGTGAGLPKFLNIPGENLIGVFSANEYLTRANLMKGYDKDHAATPIYEAKHVVVCGAGNVAMDAARMAFRLGAETVDVVYRRTRNEMPARLEEIGHAEEEGVNFRFLENPVEVLGNEEGKVVGVRCLSYELGEPDESGRRSPVAIPGSEHDVPCDAMIVALGNGSNPLLVSTTPGLDADKRGHILVDEKQATHHAKVWAGGDIVLGAATVILAMGEGRKAAAGINEYLAK
jgi:glutamate synthase (NADPH/NADH) small chain